MSSLPPRFAKKTSSSPRPPLISLIKPRHDLLLSAASDIGFFHLTDHGIASDLFNRAIQESASLFQSEHASNIHSALGFSHDDEDEENNGDDGGLVFDTCSTELDAFPDVKEYAKKLGRVGLEVVEMILSTAGLENPFQSGNLKPKCLMWVSSVAAALDAVNDSVIKEEEEEAEMEKRKMYPYVVSLQYEMKASSVMADSGEWIAVDPCADSILVMLGDIAQVWSNGGFKKVRGIPRQNRTTSDDDDLHGISISLLVTLPMDSRVSPLLPLPSSCRDKLNGDEEGDAELEGGRLTRFRSFSFEEYAWRVYHDRFPFKDPLLRYKI